jgi:CCR4-NOT transcription complex subunit 1
LFSSKDVFHNGIKNLFEEYKFYTQYPERELHLTAQLFGGLFERGLFQHQALVAAFRAILEGLKKPTGSNLWNFAVTALDRCKARFVLFIDFHLLRLTFLEFVNK